MTSELSIREVVGVVGSGGVDYSILAVETDSVVVIKIGSQTAQRLSPQTAHRLARGLHRVASRIERRIDAEATK